MGPFREIPFGSKIIHDYQNLTGGTRYLMSAGTLILLSTIYPNQLIII